MYSQLGQDQWVLSHCKEPGVFVDVGAHDGKHFSNTLLLEERGWAGICVDCNAATFPQLQANRKCTTLPYAAWSHSGHTLAFNQHSMPMLSSLGQGQHTVETRSLNDICDGLGDIDYISLDTEGTEVEILSTFDWSHNVKCWSVEHNNKKANINALANMFNDRGYLWRLWYWDLLAVKDEWQAEGVVVHG